MTTPATSLKLAVMSHVLQLGHEVDDLGTYSAEPVDYPPYCAACARHVVGGLADMGIVIGGSGQGEQIAANKVHGARAALCHDEYTARLARLHNNANVLSLGARHPGPGAGVRHRRHFLVDEFQGGRHQARLDEIHAIEVEESRAWAEAQEANAALRPVPARQGRAGRLGAGPGPGTAAQTRGIARRASFPLGTACWLGPCCAARARAANGRRSRAGASAPRCRSPRYSAEYTAGAVDGFRELPVAGPAVGQGGKRGRGGARVGRREGAQDGQDRPSRRPSSTPSCGPPG